MEAGTATAAIDLNRAFVSDLEALTPGDWERPSDCAGWNVAAVVVHLTQVAELLSNSVRRGLAGDSSPPPQAANGVQAFREWRAERLKAALKQPPAELLGQYRTTVSALEQQLEGLSAAPVEAHGWHPAGPQPLEWFADQWLFELALHDWDIRVPVDPDAEVRSDYLPAFAQTLPPRLGRGFTGADDAAVAGSYRIVLEGDVPIGWLARVADGGIDILPVEAVPPDVTIRTDPGALALVMTNRRPAADFEAAGRWRSSGDAARAAAFARAFKSY